MKNSKVVVTPVNPPSYSSNKLIARKPDIEDWGDSKCKQKCVHTSHMHRSDCNLSLRPANRVRK